MTVGVVDYDHGEAYASAPRQPSDGLRFHGRKMTSSDATVFHVPFISGALRSPGAVKIGVELRLDFIIPRSSSSAGASGSLSIRK